MAYCTSRFPLATGGTTSSSPERRCSSSGRKSTSLAGARRGTFSAAERCRWKPDGSSRTPGIHPIAGTRIGGAEASTKRKPSLRNSDLPRHSGASGKLRTQGSRAALLLLLLHCGRLSTEPNGAVSMIEIHKEQQTGVQTKREEIITTAARWDSVWQEIVSNRSPKPARPSVDFSSQVLVFVARGETADSCRSITINHVEADHGQFVVFVDDIRAPMSCSCPPVTVKPVHVVAVARLASTATFHYRSVTEGAECN
jgi:hypothetical protein